MGSERAEDGLHPAHDAHRRGLLDVGDGHRIAWEVCGAPGGRPAVVLHGGPGSGRSRTIRRCFDPAVYRLVLFDQRGCGESVPHAADAEAGLAANTTEHLLADIERLRRHLGIDRWLVCGGSWGSTLALAYAQRHPEQVTGLILRAVAMTTRAEVDWITRGARMFLPDAWERFSAGAPEAAGRDLVDAYHARLMSPDEAVRERAARDWCAWEAALVGLHAGQAPDPRWDDARFRLGFARLVTHYWRHGAWIEEGCLLRGAGRLRGIPGHIIHGRLDIGSPPKTAYDLAQAWPDAEVTFLDAAGHDARDPGMNEALRAAADRLANLDD